MACFKKQISIDKDEYSNEKSISDIRVLIEVDHPNNDIYKAEGTVIQTCTEEKYNFDINNILLRVYN